MTRITKIFKQLKNQNRKALIPYITAGDPNAKVSVQLMQALVKGGADIIELGMPFSDPMADGPVIEAAHHRALGNGASVLNVLQMVDEFRKQDAQTPIVLMGYLNPIEAMGYKKFINAAAKVGVDAVLIVDLPLEEAADWLAEMHAQELDPIFLITPTTTVERTKKICEQARGYLYYVSLKGVTGSAALDAGAVANKITEIRQQTKLPLAVGFGIRDAVSAANIADFADGVIVGTALVAKIAELNGQDKMCDEVGAFLNTMRVAMDKL